MKTILSKLKEIFGVSFHVVETRTTEMTIESIDSISSSSVSICAEDMQWLAAMKMDVTVTTDPGHELHIDIVCKY